MYGEGIGVPHDTADFLQWARKAADQGDAYGQLALGLLLRGEDDAEATKWARKAADQAMCLLN